ncbi:hypothetical protein E2P81_ATG02406 [Venturia nashicola]|nr:hypothetical protein E2P81_ATG02406 [Venturia nashicola]
MATQPDPLPQPEWQDSYLHLMYMDIFSHDDDVGHKLEPGQKHEGGAQSLERRTTIGGHSERPSLSTSPQTCRSLNAACSTQVGKHPP